MLDQEMIDEVLPFLKETTRPQSPRWRRAKKTYFDDVMQVLFPEPEKKPSSEADPSSAAAPGDSASPSDGLKLTQVVQRLRAEREAQGLSLGDLHDASGITQGRLSRLENGVEINPTIGTLDRIAEALGLRLVVTVVEVPEPEEA